MGRLTLDPTIPLALWVPLALAAAGLLAWYAWSARERIPRRRRGWILGLMAVAVAIPLAILLNPIWIQRVPPPPGLPLLTVLVDRSASMAARDAAEGASRHAVAARLAAEAADRLKERYEVRLLGFAERAVPVTPQQLAAAAPDGPATDIAAAAENALEDQRSRGQGLLVLSDGGQNGPGGTARLREVAAKARATATPIFTQTLGGPAGIDDLEVSLETPEELAFLDQRLPVTVRLRQRGAAGSTTRVALVQDGKTLHQRTVTLRPNATVEETFEVAQPKVGLYRYEVQADPLRGEATEVNNHATLLLRVVDQPVRVLLLEGKPYWDTKFLVRTLSADTSIELTSVVQVAEGRLIERRVSRTVGVPPSGGAASSRAGDGGGVSLEKPAGDTTPSKDTTPLRDKPPSPPAPLPQAGEGSKDAARKTPSPADTWTIRKDAAPFLADPKTLATYQVLVLGRNAEVFLNEASIARLKQWVVEGQGALVCFRGPPTAQITERLAELLPVRWAPARQESHFRAQWTSRDASVRWAPPGREDVFAAMPSLASQASVAAVSPLATVLAARAGPEGQKEPVIVYQQPGGRVVVLEGAGMWRWAFLPPEHRQHDQFYATLWRNLIRWLVADASLLPSQKFALRADKVIFSTAESAGATLRFRDAGRGGDAPQVELSGGALSAPRLLPAAPQADDPRQFRVVLGPLPEGRYTLRLPGADATEGAALAAFDVRGNLAERLEIQAQPDVLKLLADLSGGEAIEKGDVAGEVARKFDQRLAQSHPERVVRTPAWDELWMMALAVALWASAWGVRRSSGLV